MRRWLRPRHASTPRGVRGTAGAPAHARAGRQTIRGARATRTACAAVGCRSADRGPAVGDPGDGRAGDFVVHCVEVGVYVGNHEHMCARPVKRPSATPHGHGEPGGPCRSVVATRGLLVGERRVRSRVRGSRGRRAGHRIAIAVRAHGSSAPPTTCSGTRRARTAIGDVDRVLRAISSRLRTSQLQSLARPVTGSNGSARFLPTEIGIFRAVGVTLCVTPQGGTGCLLPKLPPHHPLVS